MIIRYSINGALIYSKIKNCRVIIYVNKALQHIKYPEIKKQSLKWVTMLCVTEIYSYFLGNYHNCKMPEF